MSSVAVAVVGRGMIGSAAARHLAESGTATALIGPSGPGAESGPFSSHDDQGRITRIAGRSPEWSELAARSIRRYGDIAARSGIEFHTPAGLVVALATLDDWIDSGLIAGSDVRKVEPDWVRSSTGIDITNGLPIGYETAPAGHINPRRLVEAQAALAEAGGATVVDDAVTAIERTSSGFSLSGGWGSITADRVLIATGAFGRGLLGGLSEGEPVLERRARTILLAEVGPMATPVPSLIVDDPPDDRLTNIYWVPPVEFPDGRTYLKIGGTLTEDRSIDDEAELIEWFGGTGYGAEIEALEAALRGLLPDVELTSFSSKPCVVTVTPSEHPYIGFVDDGVAVALGGNGSAAKSSDEIGRLAAALFSDDGWNDPLDPAMFEPQLA